MPITIAELIARFGADTSGLVAGVATSKTELVGLEAQAVSAAEKTKAALGGIGTAAEQAAGKANVLTASITRVRREVDSLAIGQGKIAAIGLAFGKIGTGVAVGVAGAALGAAKIASDFQTMTTAVSNNAGMTVAETAKMRASVLALSSNTGESLDTLADGYMHVANFGYRGADATKILTEATKSAVATNSNAGDTANILANVMHEYGANVNDASKYMNVLHLAAQRGNMTLQQFNDAAGVAIGVAANFKVPLTDAAAAMSALTQHGYDAARAATQVQDILVHISAPSPEVRKELEYIKKATGVDLVYDFSAAGIAAKHMSGVLDDVEKVVGKNTSAIQRFIPALRGGLGAFALIGTAAQDYKGDLTQLNDAMAGKLDPTTKGFNDMMGNADRQWKVFVKTVEAEVIPAGLKLLPVLTSMLPMLKDVADDLVSVIDAFSKLPEPVQKAIILFGVAKAASGALGLNFAGLGGSSLKLVGGFGGVKMAGAEVLDTFGLMATEGTAAAAGLGLVALAAAGVALDVYLIKKDWDLATDAYNNYKAAAAGNAAADAARAALDKTGDNKRNMIGEAAKIAYEQGNILAGENTLKAAIAELKAHGKFINEDGNGTRMYLPKNNPETIAALADKEKALASLQAAYAAQEVNRQKLLKAANAPALKYTYTSSGDNPAWAQTAGMTKAGQVVQAQFGTLVNKCGYFINALVDATGTVKGFHVGVAQADKSLRVQKDASGLYPAGTILHLDPQHYVEQYLDSRGAMRLIENNLGNLRTDRLAASVYGRIVTDKNGPQAFMPTAALAQKAGPFVPAAVTGAGMSGDQITAGMKAQKAAEDAAKKAQKAKEEALRQAKDYMAGLEKEVALYGQTGKAAEVSYEIAHHGLDYLTKAEQVHALALAKQYDAEAHKGDDKGTQYLDNLRQEIALYGQDGKAAEIAYQIKHGGIDNLTADQEAAALALAKQYDATVKTHDATEAYTTAVSASHDAAEELRKSLALGKDATEAQSLAYDHAHTSLAGMTPAQQAFIRMQWGITEALQAQADQADTLAEALDSLKGLQTDYGNKAAGAAGYQTEQQKAQASINDILNKGRMKGLNANDPALTTATAGVLSSAIASDTGHASEIVQKWLDDLNTQADKAKAKIGGSVNPATKAVDAFLKANEGAIRELTAILGKDQAAAAVGSMTAGIAAAANIDKAAAALEGYKKKVADVNKQYETMAANSPFDAWKQSIQEYDKATGTVGEPFGDADLKRLYTYEQGLKDIQDVSKGLTDALFGSLSKAFQPQQGIDQQRQFLSSLQAQRYSVGIQAANFNTATGVPNPYTAELNSIDQRIAQTQGKIKSMGVSLQNVFHTVFTGIIGEFDTMIAQIAENALKQDVQQALTGFLTKALGKPIGGDPNAKLVAAEQAQQAAIIANTAKMGDLITALNAAAQASANAGAASASTSSSASGGGFGSYLGLFSSIAGMIPGGAAISQALGVAGQVAGAFTPNAAPASSSKGLYTPGQGSYTTQDGQFTAPGVSFQGGYTPPTTSITMNIQTPDITSFQQSSSQIAQQAAAATGRAQARNGK